MLEPYTTNRVAKALAEEKVARGLEAYRLLRALGSSVEDPPDRAARARLLDRVYRREAARLRGAGPDQAREM